MEIIYLIFIFPLESLMELVLSGVLEFSGNPTLSLLAVSLFVTVGSLPLYHIAEKWQDSERAIQKRLKPKVDEFKAVFKGSALNTYLHTLYRQNGYHPISAARTSLGLLIQIPFFIAAYHLLSNFEAFNGVTTALFHDLSKPDGIIKIGAFSFNIMPFIMTAVNLISAAIYGKKVVKKEKIQLYGIAFLFLVVLYNASSALLFYWTANNFFSLIKNVIYNFFSGRKKVVKVDGSEKPKGYKILAEIYSRRPRGWIAFILFILYILLFLVFYEVAKSGTTASYIALILSFIILLCFNFFSFVSLILQTELKGRILLLFIFGSAIASGLILLFIWISNIDKNMSVMKVAIYLYLGLLLFDIVRNLGNRIADFFKVKKLTVTEHSNTLFTLILFTLGFLLFIATPLTLLASGFASDFNEYLSYYLYHLSMLLVVFFVVLITFYSFLSPSWKTLFIYIFSGITVFALINVFLFPANYGDMSNFFFEKGIHISGLLSFLNISVLVVVMAAVYVVIHFKKTKALLSFFSICLISLVILSINEGYSFNKNIKGFVVKSAVKFDKVFTLSKSRRNVIIIMLDRFIGGYVPGALKLLPQLEKQFDGFIWYPESLSTGSDTISGVPSIMGGWDYDVGAVNKTRTSTPLLKKLDESIRVMPYNFSKAGFETSVYAPISRWFNRANREHLEKSNVKDLTGKYSKLWMKEKKKRVGKDNVKNKLAMFGLFRIAPLALRKTIYDDGDWNLGYGGSSSKKIGKKFVSFKETNSASIKRQIKNWSTMDYLPEISEASEKAPGQFYYFASKLPHEPRVTSSEFKLNLSGKVKYPTAVYEKFNKSLNSVKHLYTDTASLKMVAEWFDWMKKNGVYDNTRIILVSDHGRAVYNPLFDKQLFKRTRHKTSPAHFHNLMMIKDFNSHGKLRKKYDFVTTNDIPYLAMEGIVEGVNPYTGNKVEKREHKFPFTVYRTYFRKREQKKYRFPIKEAFQVSKKSIFKFKNWKKIDAK